MIVAKETVQYEDDGSYWVESQHDDTSRTVIRYDKTGAVVSTTPYTAEENAEADQRATTASQAPNAEAIKTALRKDFDNMQLILNQTNADLATNPAPAIKAMARTNRHLIRLVANLLDGTD